MIKIIVDSCSSMSLVEAKEKNIDVIPMTFEMNEKIINPLNNEIDPQEFYDKLKDHSTVVKTSCIAPQVFYEAFEKYVKDNNEVIFISLSKGLTAGFNNAVMAKEMILEEYPNAKVEIINSLSGSIGIKIVIEKAIELINKNLSIDEIKIELDNLANKVYSAFTIGSLYHLYRGGRLRLASLLTGNLLRIKPIITTNSEGKLEKKETHLGSNKAISGMVDLVVENIDKNCKNIYVGYTNNLEDAKKFVSKIKERLPEANIILEIIDETMGCHCGPNTIAVFFVKK